MDPNSSQIGLNGAQRGLQGRRAKQGAPICPVKSGHARIQEIIHNRKRELVGGDPNPLNTAARTKGVEHMILYILQGNLCDAPSSQLSLGLVSLNLARDTR